MNITLDSSLYAHHVVVGAKGSVYAWVGSPTATRAPPRGAFVIAAGRLGEGDEIACTPLTHSSRNMRTLTLSGALTVLGEVAVLSYDGLVTFLDGPTVRTERIRREKPPRNLYAIEQVGDMLVAVGSGGQVYSRTATEAWRLLGGAPLRVPKSEIVLFGATRWRDRVCVGGAQSSDDLGLAELPSASSPDFADAILRHTYRDRACLWALEGDRFVPQPHTLRVREWAPLGVRGDRLLLRAEGTVYDTTDLQTFRDRFFTHDMHFRGFAQTTTQDLFLLNGHVRALEDEGLVEIAPEIEGHALDVVDDRIFVSSADQVSVLEDGAWRSWRLSLTHWPLVEPPKKPRAPKKRTAKKRRRSPGI